MHGAGVYRLSDLCAVSRLALVLKAYFDTGNDFDSTQYRSVTVAGCVAMHNAWQPWEDAWRDTVACEWAKHQMETVPDAPYFHATDVWTFSDPFARRNGWNEDSRTRLFSACTDIVCEAVADGAVKAIVALSLLEDYKRVHDSVQNTPHLVDICGNWCMAHAAASDPEEFNRDGISLFFDPADPIAGSINQRWNYGKTRERWPWSLVRSITSVRMKVSPAMQFCDLIAWGVNAKLGEPWKDDWHHKLLNIPFSSEMKFDEKTLRNPYPDQMARFLADKRPRRKPIR